MKGEYYRGELRSIEEKLMKFPCRRILFVPRKEEIPREPREVEVWDVDTVLSNEAVENSPRY